MTGKFQVHGVWLKLFQVKIPFPLGIFPAYLLYKQKRKKWKKKHYINSLMEKLPVKRKKLSVSGWNLLPKTSKSFSRNVSFSMR